MFVVLTRLGSATPREIWQAAEDLCEPVFLYRGTELPEALQAVVGMLGRSVDLERCPDLSRLPGAAEAVGIAAFNETAIVLGAEIAERLGLDFHTPATARRLTDKTAQREALRKAQVDTLRFARVSTVDEVLPALHEVGFPAVVKPVSGYGSRHTYSVNDLASATELLTRRLQAADASAYVVEQRLIGDPAIAGPRWGDYVSCETLFQDGVPYDIAVTGRYPLAEPFRETGFFMPSNLPDPVTAEVADVAHRAATALGVRTGMVHTEIKLTAEGPRVIEVNGRLGGFVNGLLQRSAGVDAVRLCLAAAMPRSRAIPEIRHDRVAFTQLVVPPKGASSLVAVDGVDQVAALPGIDSATVWGRPGSTVEWAIGYDGCLGQISGAADSHEQLASLADSVDDLLDLRFELNPSM
ncbi:ATP-grasp domain-containing protein [Kitasatospora sp. NPDC058162]|uniref:ATP-grasp domain-containing protein n=1 Tax=Kitasatospora sp. NPDC058162 TaxID=3346362 RepID=UPI0036DE2D52